MLEHLHYHTTSRFGRKNQQQSYDQDWSQEWWWSDGYATTDQQWGQDGGWAEHHTDWLAQSHTECFLSRLESWNTIDVRKNPLYVILDLGCTKSMGSRPAVNAFRSACADYGICTEILPTHSYSSFANSNTTRVWEKCRVWFPTKPPCSTEIDICEEGNVPILMSLPQMRNLNLEIFLKPDAVFLTCAAFGYDYTPAVMATSQHIVMNLSELKDNPKVEKSGQYRVSDQTSFFGTNAVHSYAAGKGF